MLGESTFLTSSWPVAPPVQSFVAESDGSPLSCAWLLFVSTKAVMVSLPTVTPV